MIWKFGAVSSIAVLLKQLGVPMFFSMDADSSIELQSIPFRHR